MGYWADRMAKSQDKISSKNIKEIEKQLAKYYGSAAKKIIAEFEATYNKILAAQSSGKQPTPADLYKLDKYWQMQGQLREELRKLGEKQVAALTKQFEVQFFDVYYSIAMDGAKAFTTIDKDAVKQMINQIWVADGKSWSERIWGNTERLAEKLNDNLIHCITTGKKTTELKKLLQDDFNVSYGRADALVRTEMAHIQTQSAQQRYKDYGVEQVEVWVDEDERTCPVCAKHEGERYPINAQMPVPFHPRCRCCMIPVIEDNERKEDKVMDKEKVNNTKTEERYITYNKKIGVTQEGADKLRTIDKVEDWDAFDMQYNRYVDTKHKYWWDGMYDAYTSKHPEVKDELKNMDWKERATHFFACIDCGEVVYKKHGKDNNQKRCDECQKKYRKWYKAQKEKERRAKKKN